MVLFSFTLYGCKKEEQGRPLSYNKGVYEGIPDSSLDENSVIILKQRTSGQSWY
jgi:hypothetical protein